VPLALVLAALAGPAPAERLRASWYGPWHHGRATATGERFNRHGLSAAHRTLPLGTILRVTNPATGRAVTVRVNDRGPYRHGRQLDLSQGAARRLGFERQGVAVVDAVVVR
jgi:rare lipoprotein A